MGIFMGSPCGRLDIPGGAPRLCRSAPPGIEKSNCLWDFSRAGRLPPQHLVKLGKELV